VSVEIRGHQQVLREKKIELEDELLQEKIREQANSRELIATTQALNDSKQEVVALANRTAEQENLIADQAEEITTLRVQLDELELVSEASLCSAR
jgi:hypothetical protein